MRPASIRVLSNAASYDEIIASMHVHKELKHLHASAVQGYAFFLYQGGTTSVLCVLPGGNTVVVPTILDHLHTDPDLLYVMGYGIS